MKITSINNYRITASGSDPEKILALKALGFSENSGIFTINTNGDMTSPDVGELLTKLHEQGFELLSNPKDMGPLEIFEMHASRRGKYTG